MRTHRTLLRWPGRPQRLRRPTRLRRLRKRDHPFLKMWTGFVLMVEIFFSADLLCVVVFSLSDLVQEKVKKAMLCSDIGRLNCNISCTTFATPVLGQGSDHKEFSSMLHKALESAIILETFPKTMVDVFALVLESGGIVISYASLALADAGIMMYDLVTSVSVPCLGTNLVIDPISEEESYQDGSLMITCRPSCNEVTQLTLTGEWSTLKIHEAVELCLDACLKLGKIMRSCLKEAASVAQE